MDILRLKLQWEGSCLIAEDEDAPLDIREEAHAFSLAILDVLESMGESPLAQVDIGEKERCMAAN